VGEFDALLPTAPAPRLSLRGGGSAAHPSTALWRVERECARHTASSRCRECCAACRCRAATRLLLWMRRDECKLWAALPPPLMLGLNFEGHQHSRSGLRSVAQRLSVGDCVMGRTVGIDVGW